MSTGLPYYPWYGVVSGDELQQGDILQDCPFFSPISINLDDPQTRSEFQWEQRDAIILTQSCDLVKGRGAEDRKEVLFAALLRPSQLATIPATQLLASKAGLNELRAGRRPSFHLLAPPEELGFAREPLIVSFQHLRSLVLPYVRHQAQHHLRLRLLPPYREHLSQAFARYFMRVGLPIDIPPFE